MAFDKEIIVDTWRTGAHKVEIGIKREEELRAKSRQFTKDSDFIGQVEIDDETYGYVSIREDPWAQELPSKQLILKYFSKSIVWKATLEQLVAKSLMQSVGGEFPLPYFMINLESSEFLLTLEKVKRKPAMGKNQYVFSLLDDQLHVFTYSIETDRFSFGSDWVVKDQTGSKIAEIDGSAFNIGGKYTIRIDTSTEYYHKEIDTVLVLFSALNKYLEDLENDLEKSIEMIRKQEGIATISREESMLYLNPRIIKM